MIISFSLYAIWDLDCLPFQARGGETGVLGSLEPSAMKDKKKTV